MWIVGLCVYILGMFVAMVINHRYTDPHVASSKYNSGGDAFMACLWPLIALIAIVWLADSTLKYLWMYGFDKPSKAVSQWLNKVWPKDKPAPPATLTPSRINTFFTKFKVK